MEKELKANVQKVGEETQYKICKAIIRMLRKGMKGREIARILDVSEGDGFLLLYKRLESGRFNWPRNEQEVRDLTHEQYIWLTQGLSVDQPKAIKKIEGGVDIC